MISWYTDKFITSLIMIMFKIHEMLVNKRREVRFVKGP